MRLLNDVYNFLKKHNQNFVFLIFFMVVITLVRNLLEYFGSNKESFGIGLAFLLNTYTYVLLMVFAEGYLINFLLNGNKKQLRRLIQEGSILLFYLFIIIPIFNIIFNYRIWNLPIFFDIPFLMWPHYGPVGIHVAFALVLFYLPFWLKRIYSQNYFSIFKITSLFYIAHFLLYYQITMPLTRLDLDLWSISFFIPVLVLFPFLFKKYSKDKLEEKTIKRTYLCFILLFIFLIYSSFIPHEVYEGSLNEKPETFLNSYFMILDTEYEVYYGVLISQYPFKNNFDLKIYNSSGKVLDFQGNLDLTKAIFNKRIINNPTDESLYFNNGSIVSLRKDSLGFPFFWNSQKIKKSESQFSLIEGYEDFSKFELTLTTEQNVFDLSGFGVHEIFSMKDPLVLDWDDEIWFYFITEDFSGIYIKYDNYVDGAVFDSRNGESEEIKGFKIIEENQTEIAIQTSDKIFTFNLIENFKIAPYPNSIKIYSQDCQCYKYPIHKIYKLKQGSINMRDKSINLTKGYFQLETLN